MYECRAAVRLSARNMSLMLGLSESYINKVENGKSLPSMAIFFDICDFLEMTPYDFFDLRQGYPQEVEAARCEMNKMNRDQICRMTLFLKDINTVK